MKYIQPVNRPLSGSLVAQVYTSLRADFGLVPEPLTLHSPVPYLLAGFWCLMREAQLVGRVSREIKEAVAAGVSAANVCPYCVEIHGTLATERGPNLALQIKQGRVDEIEPLALRQAVAWGQANLSPGADLLQRPPFTLSEAPEIIGTALAYHYINRMVRIFLGESLLPQPLRDTPLRDFAWPLVRWRLTGSMQRPKTSGTSLAFVSEAPLPPDLRWAESSPTIARALAAWVAGAERAGSEVLSPQVRTLVGQHVAAWKGKAPGLSRGWVEQAVVGLNEADQAAARLTLLTALASYQVDDRTINAFRVHHPSDADLVKAVAWASLTATRRVGSWLLPGIAD